MLHSSEGVYDIPYDACEGIILICVLMAAMKALRFYWKKLHLDVHEKLWGGSQKLGTFLGSL